MANGGTLRALPVDCFGFSSRVPDTRLLRSRVRAEKSLGSEPNREGVRGLFSEHPGRGSGPRAGKSLVGEGTSLGVGFLARAGR